MSREALGARHQRVQLLRRLIHRASARATEGSFVAEGIKVVDVALQVGAPVESLFIAAEGRGNPTVDRLADEALRRGARVFDLGPGVMERVADAVTPQPVCAVVSAVDVPLGDVVGTAATGDVVATAATGDDSAQFGKLVVVCVNVRDPGNLGTVMRSASASGAAAIVVCAGSVDPYNPKTVRASAGSVFTVPLVRAGEPGEGLAGLREAGFELIGTQARGGTDYLQADLGGRVALVLGNEASGLPGDLGVELDGLVTIPMAVGTESLNVAMTAAVLCFEAARRRREAGGS